MREENKKGKMTVAEAGSKGGSERAKQHEDTTEAMGKTSLEGAGRKGGLKTS
jgi:hypothetical protein